MTPSTLRTKRKVVGQPASRYVGVAWAKEERRWRVGIQIKGRTQGLGFFVEEETAARNVIAEAHHEARRASLLGSEKVMPARAGSSTIKEGEDEDRFSSPDIG